MAKKSELLTKKWSELTKKERFMTCVSRHFKLTVSRVASACTRNYYNIEDMKKIFFQSEGKYDHVSSHRISNDLSVSLRLQ